MTKKLSFILIFSLLAVQMFSTLHMAEHGFEEHEHQGHVCDVYLYSQHQQQADHIPLPLITEQIEYVSFTYFSFIRSNLISYEESTVNSRAPPVFS